MAEVSTLRVAPVKGLATVTMQRVRIDIAGAVEDRRLFLLDETGAVVTLRTHPQLVQVTPRLDLDERELAITLPDGTTATSALGDAGQPARAHLFGKDRTGRIVAGDVAERLSAFIGQPLRVVLGDVGIGWDEGPVSLLGRASADAIGGSEHDRARYRMLIELDGTEPFEEDAWVGRDIEVGDARLSVVAELVRCVIITQSPATGAKDWDGLHALAQLRGPDRLCLGVIGEVARPGDVWVGAPVTVIN